MTPGLAFVLVVETLHEETEERIVQTWLRGLEGARDLWWGTPGLGWPSCHVFRFRCSLRQGQYEAHHPRETYLVRGKHWAHGDG